MEAKVRGPEEAELAESADGRELVYQHDAVPAPGDYCLCVANPERWSSIRVDLTIAAYHLHRFQAEQEEEGRFDSQYTETMDALGAVFDKVMQSQVIMQHQAKHFRFDFRLQEENEAYVGRVSWLLSTAVVVSAAAQVYLIRQMFGDCRATPDGRPRA